MAAAAATGVAFPLSKSAVYRNPELNSNFISGLPLKGLCLQLKPPKVKSISSVVTAASAVSGGDDSGGSGGRFYLNFTGFPFPLGPFLNRRTIRTEVSFSYQDFG